MKALKIHRDRKTGRKVLPFKDGEEIITIPESFEEMINMGITSESGIWDKAGFFNRFEPV